MTERQRRIKELAERGLKICSLCKAEKPLVDFHFNKNLGHYRSECRQCQNRRHQRRRVARLASDPEFRSRTRDYQRRYMANRLGKTPKPTPTLEVPLCPSHGKHDEWKHTSLGMVWWCQKCRRDRKRESAKARTRIKEPPAIGHWLRVYGEEMAMAFKAFLEKHPDHGMSGRNLVFAVKKWVLQRDYGLTIDKERSKRVMLLNKISGKPQHSLKLGWSCRMCGVFHTHWHFFDVDHIFPRSCGGGNGYENLQILCPSCHRRKTLNITTLPKGKGTYDSYGDFVEWKQEQKLAVLAENSQARGVTIEQGPSERGVAVDRNSGACLAK